MKPATHAPAYAVLYPLLCEVARAHGYALALHGSMSRDADLIACPWTDEAVDALTLVKALKQSIGAVTHGDEWDDLAPACDPTPKPHGRVAYSLHLTNRGAHGPYFDVSVMPRLSP